MQLRADALDAHLAKTLAPLYVITSDEHLLAIEAADRVRAKARASGFTEREVLVVDRHFKWGELIAASQAMSLFGDRKLIELRLPGGKPGKEGGQALQEYAAARAQSAEAGDTAEIFIFGDIGESWDGESVAAKDFVRDIAALDVSHITVRINSYGGSVPDGLAIYNVLKRSSAKKIGTVDGVALSTLPSFTINEAT